MLGVLTEKGETVTWYEAYDLSAPLGQEEAERRADEAVSALKAHEAAMLGARTLAREYGRDYALGAFVGALLLGGGTLLLNTRGESPNEPRPQPRQAVCFDVWGNQTDVVAHGRALTRDGYCVIA